MECLLGAVTSPHVINSSKMIILRVIKNCKSLLLSAWDIAESSSWQLCIPRNLQLAECSQMLCDALVDFRF